MHEVRTTPGRDEAVRVTEVSLRDGLQDVAGWVPTEEKLRLLRVLDAAGLTGIEVTSFVRADRVPQLADADQLASRAAVADHPGWSALVPNRTGLRRALDRGFRRVTVVLSASDAHNRANLGAGLDAWVPRIEGVIGEAVREGAAVRAAISVAFGCPFEGEVPAERVVELGGRLRGAGAEEISLADTIGCAEPEQVTELVRRVASAVGHAPALHLHGVGDRALANVPAGLEAGVRHFDAALTGIGGCPYAPGAPGNLATERLVEFLGPRCALEPARVATAAAAVARAVAAARPLAGSARRGEPAASRGGPT